MPTLSVKAPIELPKVLTRTAGDFGNEHGKFMKRNDPKKTTWRAQATMPTFFAQTCDLVEKQPSGDLGCTVEV